MSGSVLRPLLTVHFVFLSCLILLFQMPTFILIKSSFISQTEVFLTCDSLKLKWMTFNWGHPSLFYICLIECLGIRNLAKVWPREMFAE